MKADMRRVLKVNWLITMVKNALFGMITLSVVQNRHSMHVLIAENIIHFDIRSFLSTADALVVITV